MTEGRGYELGFLSMEHRKDKSDFSLLFFLSNDNIIHSRKIKCFLMVTRRRLCRYMYDVFLPRKSPRLYALTRYL